MKKEWIAPQILSEDLSATAFNAQSGDEIDGYYLDHETCLYEPIFQS